MNNHEPQLRDLRARFESEQGYWSDTWEQVLQAAPEFFAAYVELVGAPVRREALEPRFRELVHLAVASAGTYLYEPGVRIHMRRALELGATREEIIEVLQLTATLGIHACNVGTPLLIDAYREVGQQPAALTGELTERQLQLKAAFERERGYWNPFWDGLLRFDPDFFAAYTDFSSIAWRQGPLAPKEKEMIYMAFDAAATHMFLPGLRLHIDNAIGYGASAEEMVEVFEIASGLGMSTLAMAIPILNEELDRAAAVSRP
ncbi:MAG TPA: carboxymuconolactone decarboxylase family protein [Solirubrobacteraceae bacterium]|nr:carboxymuconolactone decarboxylase family protein [Solirubrobacteraceae bacterium]